MVQKINLEAYQLFIDETSMYIEHHEGSPMELGYLGLGFGGEAGEVLDLLKKMVRNGSEEFPRNKELLQAKVIDELGDVMWYAFHLMRFFDTDLDEVLDQNMVKLRARLDKGTIGNLVRL